MTSSYVLRQVTLYVILYDGFRKSDHDFLKAFWSKFSYGMHGFWDNEVYLQVGYDVIVISPPGALHVILYDGFWNGDHVFLIAFHSNFLLGMHGFRDNEVLLQAGYDQLLIAPIVVISK